ncbi:MAG: 23S rRNA (guanosine(2251)-2'-O)-methyltransferase RlmB [Victivallales bacterium]|nr:23S rRNA (guanosine(2251)-2'-O)-methyltransferase RlmB [Victivallales bacterium]
MRRDKIHKARANRHSNFTSPVRILGEEHLLNALPAMGNPLLLLLDGIQDPHNLGACLRSADAAGVDAVIVPKDRAVSLTETVRKIACGAAESVMFVQVTNLADMMLKLKDRGIWLTGTSDKAEKSIYETSFSGPSGIVVGAEGSGIRRLTADRCDYLASIPMMGKVSCLNASVATGVVLFEALRQRIANSLISE